MRAWLSVGIPLVTLVLAGGALWWHTTPEAPEVVVDPREAATYGDFEVQTASGPVRLSDRRGEAVIVYFGYTSCPDICPTTMAMAAGALDQLSDEDRARSGLLFVSVDPERDTLAHLQEYTEFFDPSFIGATASSAEIAAIARDWGVVYRRAEDPGSAMGYSVDHSTQSFLVGPDGQMLGEIAHGTSSTEVAERIREALRSTGP